MNTPERHLEEQLIEKLRVSKYEYRSDIRDRALGRVYEYFLGKFAAAEGKLGGIIREQLRRIDHA